MHPNSMKSIAETPLFLLSLVFLMLTAATHVFGSDGRPMRVAVVGAGAAGLTAARTLTALGHEVVVFEKENRVGGKVFSLKVGSDIGLDLGAVYVTRDDYPITLGYAEEFGVPTVPGPIPIILDEFGNKLTLTQFLSVRYPETEVAEATANYAAMLKTFSDFIDAPGFVHLDHDLKLPFNDFAALYGIEPVAEMVRALMIGFGYGYYETVPAAYYVKFLPFLAKVGQTGLKTATGRIFPTGFQSVFEALAETMDVRLNAEVTHIRRPRLACRKRCKVWVTVNGVRKHMFDAVVIATPLNVVPDFLDATPRERRLFEKVRSNRFFVTLFGATGIQGREALFFYANARPDWINHVVAWGSPFDAKWLFAGNSYQIVDRDISAGDAKELLSEGVAEQGGRFLGALAQKEWRNYFPYVSSELIALGFYDWMDGKQGQRQTYYVGSSLTFETVEHAARQARSIIQRHFGNQSELRNRRTGGNRGCLTCSAYPIPYPAK